MKYEQEHYETTRKKMPKIGREVITPDGTGPVTELNILKETVFVRLTNGDTSEIREYPLDAITKPGETHTHSETSRKNKEKNTETQEQAADGGIEADSYHQPDTDTEKEDVCEETFQDEEPDIQIGEKPKTKSEKGVLGRPVRRQNPKRSDEPKQNEETVKQPDGSQKEEQKNQKSSWADALQKAMQAIGQDK